VVNDLDLADQVGFLTAYDVIQTVAVDDGALTIEAVSGVQNAKLSGFSIWEADEPIVEPPSTDAPTFVYALNAGGGAFTAENGVVYEGDDLGSVSPSALSWVAALAMKSHWRMAPMMWS